MPKYLRPLPNGREFLWVMAGAAACFGVIMIILKAVIS